MSSFFSDIKSQLRQDCGGRYLAFVLRAAISSEPRLARALFPKLKQVTLDELRSGAVTVETEQVFLGRRPRRRADLAILKEGQVIAMAEIKYRDHKAEGNDAQAEDYLEFLARPENRGVQFTLVSEFDPSNEVLARLENNESAQFYRYRELYERISKLEKRSGVAELVLRFMEETCMLYKENVGGVDDKVLLIFMLRSLNTSHYTGLGKIHSQSRIQAVPALLEQLLSCTQVLADELQSKYQSLVGKNRINVTFAINPNFSSKAVRKLAEQVRTKNSKPVDFEPKARTGGAFWTLASACLGPMGRSDSVYIYLGLSFDLDLKLKTLDKYLWASVLSKIEFQGASRYAHVKIDPKNQSVLRPTNLVPSLGPALAKVEEAFREALADAQADDSWHALTDVKREKLGAFADALAKAT